MSVSGLGEGDLGGGDFALSENIQTGYLSTVHLGD